MLNAVLFHVLFPCKSFGAFLAARLYVFTCRVPQNRLAAYRTWTVVIVRAYALSRRLGYKLLAAYSALLRLCRCSCRYVKLLNKANTNLFDICIHVV